MLHFITTMKLLDELSKRQFLKPKERPSYSVDIDPL